LKPERCQNCIYAVKAAGKVRSVLVCTNKQDSNGRLFLLEMQGTCRNFRAEKKILRPKVKQPENDEIRFIPLTQGKVTIVDAEDYKRLSKDKWYAANTGGKFYACRSIKQRTISMHREIMGEPKGMFVDHIDGNGLNNRRSNLRVCTPAQNVQNRRCMGGSSGYKGVSFIKRDNKWKAEITLNRRRIHIGHFADEISAAKAYDRKAAELFGEFAYLNFAKGSD